LLWPLQAKIDPDSFLLDVMMPDMDGPSFGGSCRRSTIFARRPFAFSHCEEDPKPNVKKLYALGSVSVANISGIRSPIWMPSLYEATSRGDDWVGDDGLFQGAHIYPKFRWSCCSVFLSAISVRIVILKKIKQGAQCRCLTTQR